MMPFGAGAQPGIGAVGGPAPEPAPGTANVALCNFTGQPTTFKICGMQGGQVVNKEVQVPQFSFIWSGGWEAGHNKMLTVTTPYFSKTFGPFRTSDLVVIYQT